MSRSRLPKPCVPYVFIPPKRLDVPARPAATSPWQSLARETCAAKSETNGRFSRRSVVFNSPGCQSAAGERSWLSPISQKCVTNLFCDVRLLRRFALRCKDVLSSTGFSLWGVDEPRLKPHRLKPVLLDRAGPALSLVEVNPTGNFHKVHLRNTD